MKAGRAHAAIATLHAGFDYCLGWKSAIALFMKALKSGTVKAISPQAGLLVESMFYPVVLGYTENQV
jgi:hypothetical protein